MSDMNDIRYKTIAPPQVNKAKDNSDNHPPNQEKEASSRARTNLQGEESYFHK